jgi:uncharacterized protein (DUF302 family)/uncharacterized membrane protein YidH (DUF202 family)
METPGEFQAKPTDYLAAERNFLAWIRTGLALMALGFVLARFAIFLQELNLARPDLRTASSGFSLWLGTGLILLGVLVCVLSLVRYLRLIAMMRRGAKTFENASALAVAIAILLAMVGLAMGFYLVSARPVVGLQFLKTQEATMPAIPGNGVVRIASQHSVADTVAKVEAILQAKNVKLFAVVDHSGEAEKAGLKMPNTKLLIFGNPKGGTPLMLAAPSVALDLPLKILVAEDAEGKVWVSYNASAYLQQRHNLPAELVPNIAVIEAITANAAQ